VDVKNSAPSSVTDDPQPELPGGDRRLSVVATLLIAGLGGGILQTVGPALTADSVAPEERGDAIASNGTFRAATLLIAPLGVGALVLAMPIGVALGIAGGVMLLPALVVTRSKQPVTMIAPSRTTREGH